MHACFGVCFFGAGSALVVWCVVCASIQSIRIVGLECGKKKKKEKEKEKEEGWIMDNGKKHDG